MENTPDPAQPVVATDPAPTPEQTPTPTAQAPVNPPVLLSKHHDISGFASQDQTRFVVNGIHYKPTGRYIEATDGRLLIRVPVVNMPEQDETPLNRTKLPGNVADECIMPTAPFKKGLANIKAVKGLTFSAYAKLLANGDKNVTLVTTDLDVQQSVTARSIEGQYPNTDMVMPTKEPKFKIALSPELLGKFCDYASKHGHEKESVMLVEFWDDLSPVRLSFRIDDPNDTPLRAVGILMPMRMS